MIGLVDAQVTSSVMIVAGPLSFALATSGAGPAVDVGVGDSPTA